MRLLALVLAALLLPLASAGSEDRPEIVSPQNKPDPSGDLLAVWYEHDERGLRVTFKVAQLGGDEESLVLYTKFRLHGAERSPGIGWDGAGRLRTDSGANPSGWGSGLLDDRPIVLGVERGSPAYVSLVVPWGLYGLREGDEVRPTEAASSLCCETRRGEWYAPYDRAATSSTIVVVMSGTPVRHGLFPILVPQWVLPTIVITTTSLGLAGGFAMALASKPATVPPVTSAPVSPVRPPGQRFQRAPPTIKR